jgi:hypothetical protein
MFWCCFGAKSEDIEFNDVLLKNKCIQYLQNNPGIDENRFIYMDLTLVNDEPKIFDSFLLANINRKEIAVIYKISDLIKN